jgi:O-antigen/teichoic acid export membrane protein
MRAVFQNLVSVIGGEAAVRAANFAAALFIARVFGGYVLGAYAASLAVITVAVMLAENGLQTFVITELAGSLSGRESIIGQVLIGKTILLAAALALLCGIGAALKLSVFLWTVGMWVAARTILQSYSQLQMAMLKAISKANAIGVIQLVHGIFLLTGIGLAYLRHWTFLLLLAWLCIGQLFESALTTYALVQTGARPKWPAKMQFWAVTRRSTPFGITSGLATLIVRSDTVVLAMLVPLKVLGIFSAPNSILLIVYVTAWLMGSVLLPEMVRLSAGAGDLVEFVKKWTKALVLASGPIAAITCLLAPKGIPLLFGPGFEQSGGPASLMALACPFILLNSVFTNFAIALNKRAVFAGLYAGTALLAIGLNFLLGRALGPVGVAMGIVIREGAMLAGFWTLLWSNPSSARSGESMVCSAEEVHASEKPEFSRWSA